MGYDDRREIYERLEALERQLRSRHDDRGGRDRREHEGGHRGGRDRDRHHRGGGGGDMQEKRIIDTIVHLVTEQMGRMLQDREAQARSRRRDDGEDGSEKRIVDLVVRLISEHVQEIVATELDRRLGRPAADRNGEDGPPLSLPERGSGGPRDDE